jgi:RimJ/RimL family protein N-acetyltransferase
MNETVGFDLPDWAPREMPPRTILTGQYCSVVPLDVKQHGDQLYSALCQSEDDHNWIYLPYGPYQSKDDFIAWLRVMQSKTDPFFHAVISQETGDALGLASYLRITPDIGVIEVGHIHFGSGMQRTPMATEAMYLMMRQVFDELGYRRYEWKCDALNARSRRAAQRFGFSFEGVFRQASVNKGRNRDTSWFSIIDSEWPQIRSAFENWLAADNFDSAGQQRNPLKI